MLKERLSIKSGLVASSIRIDIGSKYSSNGTVFMLSRDRRGALYCAEHRLRRD